MNQERTQRLDARVGHPVFGSEICPTCGRHADLLSDPFWRWRHCGQSWVTVGTPADIANELIAASLHDDEDC